MKKFSPMQGITIYDDVFSMREQQDIMYFCTNAPFAIHGWRDIMVSEENYIHSQITLDQLRISPFIYSKNIEQIMIEQSYVLNNYSLGVVNVDTVIDTHWAHTHTNSNVLLYYAGLKWEQDWGGETLFYDQEGKEILFGSRYTPNRVIAFDGEIPHTIKQQNRTAAKFRISLSLFFDKEKV